MLTTLLGTPFQPSGEGAFLLLEDIGEPPYKIQRMLNHLLQSGLLKGIKGVGIGSFSGSKIPKGANWSLRDVFVDFFHPLGIPVLGDLPFGHGKQNQPWLVGTSVHVTTDGEIHVE